MSLKVTGYVYPLVNFTNAGYNSSCVDFPTKLLRPLINDRPIKISSAGYPSVVLVV